jgi:hypothetical protein
MVFESRSKKMNTKTLRRVFLLPMLFLFACESHQTQPTPRLTPTVGSTLTPNEAETATLLSLKKVDDYPLYVMDYVGSYGSRQSYRPADSWKRTVIPEQISCQVKWGCSLFATLGDKENRLFGRNFDWRFSPALLLFTDPPDGYGSVSLVDIEYLGFGGDLSKKLADLPLEKRRALLNAPSIPFDGMNEEGLTIGMAAVPAEPMPYEQQKKTLDELEVIREILDHAGTVDEAIEIFGNYNIDMSNVPIHYLIASSSGKSALVEFYKGKMVVFRNQSPWQAATNFLLSSTDGTAQGQCWRYNLIEQRIQEGQGRISSHDALQLLRDVSQENTQWSILYNMTTATLEVVMGQTNSETTHMFHLEQSVP